MDQASLKSLFTSEVLAGLFPPQRADAFFEALLGDAREGSYDINLAYTGFTPERNTLHFELRLLERPGKCLACNLTYGLPKVFIHHPVINLKGLVDDIGRLLNGEARCADWSLSSTRQAAKNLHVIPLTITLAR